MGEWECKGRCGSGGEEAKHCFAGKGLMRRHAEDKAQGRRPDAAPASDRQGFAKRSVRSAASPCKQRRSLANTCYQAQGGKRQGGLGQKGGEQNGGDDAERQEQIAMVAKIYARAFYKRVETGDCTA